MKLIRRCLRAIGSLFIPRPIVVEAAATASKWEKSFLSIPFIRFVNSPPPNDEVLSMCLYCVISGTSPKWALFRCPCGCEVVITISLQVVHNPHWQLSKSPEGKPTLHPSIWRDQGCLSHFWLKDGRIVWCFDTGRHPNHCE